MRPSGLHVNKPVLFGIIGVAVTLVVVYKVLYSSTSLTNFSTFNFGFMAGGKKKDLESGVKNSQHMDKLDNIQINISQLVLPPELTDKQIEEIRKNQQKSDEVEVDIGGKKIKIHIEQVIPTGPPKLDILLLHGAAFSSANWVTIKTVYYLASWGYRAIAIDLPGKGKSPDKIDEKTVDTFLSQFISTLGMKNIVIISPSASGRYSLPYLFTDPGKSVDKAVGFIPVAPARTSDFVTKYKDSQLSTLIVYGSKDVNGPRTLKDLANLPRHKVAKLEDAGHPCYIDKPNDFHKVLFSWLKNLTA